MHTRLLASLVALAALGLASSTGAPATVTPGERLAVVAFDQGRATLYSGLGLTGSRVLRGADRAELSPEADVLAYTRLVNGWTEIRLTPVDGVSDRLVARVRPYDIALAFSPDGRELAFSSAAGLRTAAVASLELRPVAVPRTWRGSRFNHLAYVPDGRRLLVSRTWGDGRKGTLRNELALLDLASGAAKTLLRVENPYDTRARPASVSPDGSVVAVDGTGGIVLEPTLGGSERHLTQRRPSGYDHSPLFSPDGRSIAFARATYRGVADVYVVGADGSGLRRVTTTPIPPRGTPKVGATPLAWSPDGSHLLVFRHDRFAIVRVADRLLTNVRTVGIRYHVTSARWFGRPPQPPNAANAA